MKRVKMMVVTVKYLVGGGDAPTPMYVSNAVTAT